MTLAIVIAAFLVWYFGLFIAKEMYADAKNRHDDRIWAAYHRKEAARWHAQRLSEIDWAANAAAEEMVRVANEGSGQIVEGAAREVTRNG
ncbi:MAG TPA: hypothetical protein VGO31_00275 [Microbacteriaceae bacterium]|jgi:hypothetical protein|nr:hypothetical protein [Microbacteriaceae bacterium]